MTDDEKVIGQVRARLASVTAQIGKLDALPDGDRRRDELPELRSERHLIRETLASLAREPS